MKSNIFSLGSVRIMSIILLTILAAGLCFGRTTYGQEPAPTTEPTSQAEGSLETLKQGPMKFPAVEFNQDMHVFESVLNGQFLTQGHYSRMRFFLAPLLHIVPISDTTTYQRTELADLGIVRYTFRLQNYAPTLQSEALDRVNQAYSSQTGKTNAFAEEQMNLMEHGLVIIHPRLPSDLANDIAAARIPSDPTAPLDTRVSLRPYETFSFDVPQQVDPTFRTLVDTGLQFDFTVFFNVKDISMLALSFSAEELLNTQYGGPNCQDTKWVKNKVQSPFL